MKDQDIPSWADQMLSKELPKLAAAGEKQEVEFKASLPKHLGDVSKEIAAFASTNAGTIFLGIDDAGDILGVEECASADGRDKLRQRIEGLCAHHVRPSITPSVRFASVADRPVVAIDVPKGGAPIYYANNIPYMRQLTSARPMTPEEVVERVLAWKDALGTDEGEEYLSGVATLVINVQVHIEESRVRRINPWAEETRWMLGGLADEARARAVEAPIQYGEVSTELEALAEELDVIAHERPAINRDRTDVLEASNNARERVARLRKSWLPPSSFSAKSIEGLRKSVANAIEQLSQLSKRAARLADDGRFDELKDGAASIGLLLLKASAFGVGLGDDQSVHKLQELGRALREIQTRTIYMDGGASVRRILSDLQETHDQLQAWKHGADL